MGRLKPDVLLRDAAQIALAGIFAESLDYPDALGSGALADFQAARELYRFLSDDEYGKLLPELADGTLQLVNDAEPLIREVAEALLAEQTLSGERVQAFVDSFLAQL